MMQVDRAVSIDHPASAVERVAIETVWSGDVFRWRVDTQDVIRLLQAAPFAASDGGLTGLHFQEISTGAVSHGGARLSAEAITAVGALPLGTPVLTI